MIVKGYWEVKYSNDSVHIKGKQIIKAKPAHFNESCIEIDSTYVTKKFEET